MKLALSVFVLGLVCVVALIVSVPACGSGGGCDVTGTDRTFGQCCTDDSQCASGVCHAFGDGTEACTESCQQDADCPEGSQGAKCNNQGVCRV